MIFLVVHSYLMNLRVEGAFCACTNRVQSFKKIPIPSFIIFTLSMFKSQSL